MIGRVLATVLPLALLAVVGLVAAWRWVPGLRRVPAGLRWLAAAVPWARVLWWRLRKPPVPRCGELPIAVARAFADITFGWSSRGRARRARKAEAEHWAATEADR